MVKNPDDLSKLNAMAKGLNNGTDGVADLLLKVANDANLGPDVARKVVGILSELSPAQLSALDKAGQLDDITHAIAKGIDGDKIRDYANWVGSRIQTPGANTLNITSFDALLGTGMKQADVSHYLDVLGDVTVFRGTTIGFPGSSAIQAAGVTPVSIDPIVATVFAAEGAAKGANPVIYFGGRTDFGGTLGVGNVRKGLENEVGLPMLPLDFASKAPMSITLDRARSILQEMGIEVNPSYYNFNAATQALENLPRMTPEQIKQFLSLAEAN